MAKDKLGTRSPSGFYKWVAGGLLGALMLLVPVTVNALWAGQGAKVEANSKRITAIEEVAIQQQVLMTKMDKQISIQQARLDWALMPRPTSPPTPTP